MNLFKSLAAFLCCVIVLSCSEEKKEGIPPSINSLTIGNGQDSLFWFYGDEINVSGDFADNENLASLSLIISNNGVAVYTETFSFSGKTFSLTDVFILPETVPEGSYLLIAQLQDEAANITTQTFNLVVQNGFPIVYGPTGLVLTNTNWGYYVRAGGSLLVSGQVTDNRDLTFVNIRMYSNQQGPGPTEIYNERFTFPGSADKSWDFNGGLNIAVPINALKLKYRLSITTADNDGNFLVLNMPAEVDP